MRNKSGSTWKEYEARCVEAKLHSAQLPSVDDCIMSAYMDNEVQSRADLVHVVELLTGIDKREVERNIGPALNRLVRHRRLVHSGHNEWRLA